MSRSAPSLAVDLGGGAALPTPVMVASGCFSQEIAALADVRRFGGIVTRTLTYLPRRGAGSPRMVETASGLLSGNGYQNPGFEAFLRTEFAFLVRSRVPFLVSIAGSAVEELMRLTLALEEVGGASGIEVNACFPSRHREGNLYASTPAGAAEAVGSVARLTRRPVFVKLTIETADIAEVARACITAGAHGITLIQSPQAMSVDPSTFRPRIAAATGGLSGPAIRTLAVHAVRTVAKALPGVPILGVGGVASTADALELLIAGAWAVQIGTAMFTSATAPIEIAQGVSDYLTEHGISSVADLRGRVIEETIDDDLAAEALGGAHA